MTDQPAQPPTVPSVFVAVGGRHRSARLAFVAAVFHLAWTTAAIVLLATVIAGGRIDRFAIALAVIGTFVYTWPATVAMRSVWFDFDGRYLRVRNGPRPVRIPLDEISGFAWPRRIDDWGAPVVPRRDRPPVKMKSLQRFRLFGATNEVDVERHLAALESEWVEFRRRRDEGSLPHGLLGRASPGDERA